MNDDWFTRLQAFTRRIATTVGIATIGLLPRAYDKEYRKDYYGSIERDPHED
ncbi:MAG: hypothetical protein NVSMB19_02970 [Vulcanimicrobiaceae bacterium]